MEHLSEAASYTLRFINQTGRSVFLTGKAGTGKTTLLKEIIRTTHKNTAVVAPTGIAALNAGGVTIHSMFQLPLAAFLPVDQAVHISGPVNFETRSTLRRHFRMGSQKKSVIRNLELLIIDEVSMLRADLLDAMDFMLRSLRNSSHPYGGVQLLFIGDLLQLPPVVKNDEWRVLQQHYNGAFFFNAHVVLKDPPLYIELTKIYRQTDEAFISILNNLRNNITTPDDIASLNAFVVPDFDHKKHQGFITLTTHNAKADTLNRDALADIVQPLFKYGADIVDDFPEKIFPVDEQLNLKIGAQVMFIKNDSTPEKRYFNGKMGVVESLSEKEIFIHFPEENKTIEAERYEWQNIRYKVNQSSGEIEEEILGTFVHYPIRLAWAITVHKSQGLTFDKAALDVSNVFAPGQAYVALSRLRSLNGLILLSPLKMNGISNDAQVMSYSEQRATPEILADAFTTDSRKYLSQTISECFNWETLAQEWRSHRYSYQSDKAEKSKFANWAERHAKISEELADSSARFRFQINKIFSNEIFDAHYLDERVSAAVNYFFEPMDTLAGEIFMTLEAVSRIRNTKGFYEELLELEEWQTKSVLQLLKARQIIEIIRSGAVFSKDNLMTSEMRNYRIMKIEAIRERFKEENSSLLEEAASDNQFLSRTKKRKESKKSTVQETYELWQEQPSIKEIAKARKLTAQTITTHISKLIAQGLIQVEALISEARLKRLTQMFEGYDDESLSPLKEKYGADVTWDELKLFKASLTAKHQLSN